MAALLWGGSFVVLKDTLDVISPAWLMAIRFALAGVVMVSVFFPRVRASLDKGHLVGAVLLGISGGLGYLIQNIGLTDTTAGHNAFLTATYCVMVPFLHWVVARVRPTVANLAAALIAVAGVGALSLGGEDPFALRWGDWLTIVGAFWFAVQIEIMVAVARGKDIVAMTSIEFFVMSALCGTYGLLCEPIPAPAVFQSVDFWLAMGYLVLLSSCLCTIAQNVGQAHVPPAQASLLLSLESVFGVFFSVVLFGEELTLQLVAGFGLVFAAVLISELA
ncbi:MAG: DMT family transporter [Coriobacteriales bacterium]|nr:DMT family transporter [Coriobacteriales bacterium]